MAIISGDQGGIFFRYNHTNDTYYAFAISQNGKYNVFRFDGRNLLELGNSPNSSPAIHTGSQPNTIAVVVIGSTIDFYVNEQHLGEVTDNTYSQGNIGLLAFEVSNPTEVVFRNAKVWTP